MLKLLVPAPISDEVCDLRQMISPLHTSVSPGVKREWIFCSVLLTETMGVHSIRYAVSILRSCLYGPEHSAHTDPQSSLNLAWVQVLGLCSVRGGEQCFLCFSPRSSAQPRERPRSADMSRCGAASWTTACPGPYYTRWLYVEGPSHLSLLQITLTSIYTGLSHLSTPYYFTELLQEPQVLSSKSCLALRGKILETSSPRFEFQLSHLPTVWPCSVPHVSKS